jgi:CRISPR-associated protein Csx16
MVTRHQDSAQHSADGTSTRTRLVSFLGTTDYQQAKHRFPDGSEGANTRYVCRALAEFLGASEIDVLATKEAEEKHKTSLAEALRLANLPTARFYRLPSGASDAELWEQFGVIKERLRAPRATTVALDITYSFRSQPFFAAAVSAFVRAVDREAAPIKTFYGAFDRDAGETQIWDLSLFIELLDWTSALMLFLRTGRSVDVAEPTIRLGRELGRRWAQTKAGEQPRLEKLGKVLRDFGTNLETMRTGDLLLSGSPGSAASLAATLSEAKESATAAPPLADVLERVQSELIEPLLGASGHLADDPGHRALAGLARLYLGMGRWAEAAAVVREGWITRYATPAAAFGDRNQSRPSVDEGARRDAEDRWNSEARDAATEIAQVRNDIEHAGFKNQPNTADNLQRRLGKLVDDFAALSPAAVRVRAAGRTPVFVNLSSHPTSDWSDAQREAALTLAPEIKDLPFPTVPPEAGIADIASRVEGVVARFKRDFPGATHAMIQGEFTLAHALIRKLQQIGVVCLAATTRREVVAQAGDTKTTRFSFVQFREYS